jgi:hypothetical protein
MVGLVVALLMTLSLLPAPVGAEEPGWCQDAAPAPPAASASACSNLPDWVMHVVRASQLPRRYDLSQHLNPFFQSGDFNGDQKLDVAALVRNKATGQTGIGIFLYGGTKPLILGAGSVFRNGGADFN